MQTTTKIGLCALAAMAFSPSASAQVVLPQLYGPGSFAPATYAGDAYLETSVRKGSNVSSVYYLNAQDFANSIYNSVTGSMGTNLVAISQMLDRNNARLSEGIAMASALTIIPPNPGDRYSLTFGGAGFNSQGAGAITGTARLTANTVAFVGYARSASQNLVKGGVSFSFH